MPSTNSLKIYTENGYYHLYNRGVEKRLIFLDSQDYAVFLSYIKEYLSPKDEANLSNKLLNNSISYKERADILRVLKLNNFFEEIILLAYCLMPNHFHLLIKQRRSTSIDKFMNSLGTRYANYFNKKYKRVGALFQDVYKAVMVESDLQLIHLSSYIHRNPIKDLSKNKLAKLASTGDVCQGYFSQPSSYPEYLGQRQTLWVHPEEILIFFSKNNPKLSYQSFVEETEDITTIEPIQNIIIDF